MKRLFFYMTCQLLVGVNMAQWRSDLIANEDLLFLESMTKAVLDSARIQPLQTINELSGPNNSGAILIRPGGRDDYPAFWIRDYAMSLECGFITKDEQRHMLLLTASTQCDQSWITKGGSLVPIGSIADHIRIDNSLPIYFPGTYSYSEQGTPYWGKVPPLDDQFYFIHMAHYYVTSTGDLAILSVDINGKKLVDRLETAFKTPPSNPRNHLVNTTASLRGVDFGFRDGIQITGELCFPSLLKYKAALQLSELLNRLQQIEKANAYKKIAAQIRQSLPKTFMTAKGMLRASTGWSQQPDVWATALAVYYKILDGDTCKKACAALVNAYLAGTLAYKGNIRHVATTDDFNDTTAWEKTEIDKNRYQNGAYWGTPVGWVAYSIALANPDAARKLIREYISELRENDFRKGAAFGAPYECFYPPKYKQNPLYLTSVSCPYGVFISKTN